MCLFKLMITIFSVLMLTFTLPANAREGRFDILQGNLAGTFVGFTTGGIELPVTDHGLVMSDGTQVNGFDRLTLDGTQLGLPPVEFELVFTCMAAYENNDGTKFSFQRWFTKNSSEPLLFPNGVNGASIAIDNDAIGAPDIDFSVIDIEGIFEVPATPDGVQPCSLADLGEVNLDPGVNPFVHVLVPEGKGYKVFVGRD